MTPVDTYIPQMLLCMKNEGEEPSGTQKKESAPGPPAYNNDGILPALPPSFATFLMDCTKINQSW